MFDKLNENDKIYANQLIDKCKGCKGIEQCQQEMIGLIPHQAYDDLTKSYYFAFTKCKYARGWTNTNMITRYDTWEHPMRKLIVAHIKEHKGIYLWGDVGTGKTKFLYCLANQLNKKGKDVHVESTFEVVKKIKDGFNRTTEQGERTYLDKLEDVEYLFLDDLGNERKTEFNIIDVLWVLIDYRYQNNKPTFFSSNYTLAELYDMYTKALNSDYAQKQIRPIISRLKTYGEIELKGRNFRL